MLWPRPRAPILPAFDTAGGRSEGDELAVQAKEGLAKRLERHVFDATMTNGQRAAIGAPYEDRLKFELNIITQMGSQAIS